MGFGRITSGILFYGNMNNCWYIRRRAWIQLTISIISQQKPKNTTTSLQQTKNEAKTGKILECVYDRLCTCWIDWFSVRWYLMSFYWVKTYWSHRVFTHLRRMSHFPLPLSFYRSHFPLSFSGASMAFCRSVTDGKIAQFFMPAGIFFQGCIFWGGSDFVAAFFPTEVANDKQICFVRRTSHHQMHLKWSVRNRSCNSVCGVHKFAYDAENAENNACAKQTYFCPLFHFFLKSSIFVTTNQCNQIWHDLWRGTRPGEIVWWGNIISFNGPGAKFTLFNKMGF